MTVSRLISPQCIQAKSFQAKKIIRTMFFIFFCRKSAVKIGAKFHNCTRASLIRSDFITKGASTFYRIFFNQRKFTAVVRNEPLGWDQHQSLGYQAFQMRTGTRTDLFHVLLFKFRIPDELLYYVTMNNLGDKLTHVNFSCVLFIFHYNLS